MGLWTVERIRLSLRGMRLSKNGKWIQPLFLNHKSEDLLAINYVKEKIPFTRLKIMWIGSHRVHKSQKRTKPGIQYENRRRYLKSFQCRI